MLIFRQIDCAASTTGEMHFSERDGLHKERCLHAQVAECQNKEPHDWTLCVFAHPGEKARRRDPAVYKYVATACPDFRKVGCSLYSACPFLSCTLPVSADAILVAMPFSA